MPSAAATARCTSDERQAASHVTPIPALGSLDAPVVRIDRSRNTDEVSIKVSKLRACVCIKAHGARATRVDTGGRGTMFDDRPSGQSVDASGLVLVYFLRIH